MNKHVTNESKYSEYEVLRSLSKKRSIIVNEEPNETKLQGRWCPAYSITVLTEKQTSEADTIGIKTKGKLDYMKIQGWSIIWIV